MTSQLCWEQDYWHHWEDVTVGFLLGLSAAYAFYRQHFPPLSSRRAGEPLVVGVEGAPEGALELGLGRPPYVDLEAAVPDSAA